MEMATLRFKFGGIDFEYVAEPQEVEQLIQRLASRISPFTPNQTHLTKETSKQPILQATFKQKGTATLPLPNDDEVKVYIMSKPEYAHDLQELQQQFFHRTFASRGPTQAMYHRTSRQANLVRDVIAIEQKGKFQQFPIERNLIQWRFKKNEVTVVA